MRLRAQTERGNNKSSIKGLIDLSAEDSIDDWIESSVNRPAEYDEDSIQEDEAGIRLCATGNLPLYVDLGGITILKKRCRVQIEEQVET